MRRLVSLLGGVSLAACLLGSPPDPPRYFQPVLPVRAAAPADGAGGSEAAAPPLRLARMRSSAYLSERMVWRVSAVEFGFYDSRRWTEHPPHFVEQHLSRELFEVRGLRRARAGRVPILDVELLAFDEVLEPEHETRIILRAILMDGQNLSLLERTYTEVEALEDGDPASVTHSMGRALDRIVQRVANDIQAALAD